MSEGKLVVVDGNSLLFRAYYATAGYGASPSLMKTKSGVPTNAIFAFSNMMAKIISSLIEGDRLFVGFDADSHTFRKEEFKDYKANRRPVPAELVSQFPISRELLDALGVIHYEQHGIEADDICGTVAKWGSQAGMEVEVYTSDKDYLQLIDDHVVVNLLRSGLSQMSRMTEQAMLEDEKFGFAPQRIIDYKGLRGDDSDNLPGIPGIGDKGALKLIHEYGTFDAIVQAAKEGKIKGKAGQSIVENEAQGRECYKLATIITDAPLPFSLDDLRYGGYSFSAVNSFAQKYEFGSMLSRLPSAWKKGEEQKKLEVVTVPSLSGIKLPEKIGLAVDLSDLSSYHDAEIYGIAVSDGEKAYYLDAEDLKKDEVAKKMLSDPALIKNVYDGKMDTVALKRLGIDLKGIGFDSLLSAYLLDSGMKPSPEAVYSRYGMDVGDKEEDFGLLSLGHPKGCGKIAQAALLSEPSARSALRAAEAERLYSDIERPLEEVLAKMEIEGFPLDGEKLKEIGATFREKAEQAEKSVHSMAGYSFNVASPKQVAELLYDKLGLPGGKKRSTSSDVLEGFVPSCPIVGEILNYRKYSKLVGTYIDGLLPHIKEDGKIHTCFNQAETSTGRLSSSNPNLQNISTRDEEGKLIRKAFFYPNPDDLILSLDYSQIELRILAALSHCQAYIDVFNNGHDVHSETAKRIFHTDQITPLQRRRAKAVNFAIIYGTSTFGLAQQIEGTQKEAQEIIDAFYENYPEIGEYLRSIIREVEKKGYVQTMFGRRRYLRDITDPSYMKREAAKRQALNAPIQGSAADLIKIAMLKVDDFLAKGSYKTKMVLQIHDELLFKVPKEEAEEIVPKLSEIMDHAVELPVKLQVEGSLGRSWYDAKD